MRQKTELEITLQAAATGEARSGGMEGTEAQPARTETESQAAGGPSMEAIVERDNLRGALAHVKRNKGAAGIDGMSLDALAPHLKEHWPAIRVHLLEGTYKPQPVRRVEIPKASGGTRPLGIPTVLDRFIQQAVLQVLQAEWDPTFSEHSFGFRPKRSAHQAVARAQELIASGHDIVVDLDLEKFFDQVNHDILMGLVAKRVADKRVLKLIRGFLTAGVLMDGLVGSTEEGTPQGGPLSPLLSNLMLDVMDKELERRGHNFVRYADDCNIYVRSQRGGERVMASIDQAPQAQGQQGEERGRPIGQAQIPGFWLHEWEAASAAHRAAVAGSIPEPGTGTDAPDPRQKPRADHQGVVRLPHRVARLLRILRDPVGVART